MAQLSKQRKQEIEDLKHVMSTPAGRRFIWRKIGDYGVFNPCYTPESEGARRAGLELLGEVIEECPGEYLKMQSEQMSAKTRERIERSAKKEEESESDN